MPWGSLSGYYADTSTRVRGRQVSSPVVTTDKSVSAYLCVESDNGDSWKNSNDREPDLQSPISKISDRQDWALLLSKAVALTGHDNNSRSIAPGSSIQDQSTDGRYTNSTAQAWRANRKDPEPHPFDKADDAWAHGFQIKRDDADGSLALFYLGLAAYKHGEPQKALDYIERLKAIVSADAPIFPQLDKVIEEVSENIVY